MDNVCRKSKKAVAGSARVLSVLLFFLAPLMLHAATVTTTIAVSICGNGLIDGTEVCDDGLFNTGAYATSTAGRHCLPDCSGYGPFCGDNVIQPIYNEECDDGNNIDNDLCSAMCQIEQIPTSPAAGGSTGGGSGQGGFNAGFFPFLQQTKVTILGKGYPSTVVNILKDGQSLGTVQTDSNADFSYDAGNLSPGPTTFGFWSVDARGIRSITFTTTFQVTQNAVTTVSNVYLPPTLDLKTNKVKLGEMLDAFGSSAPNAKVTLFVNKEQTLRITATTTSAGTWDASFRTDGLVDETFNTVKAMFETTGQGAPVKSGFSQLVSFYIGNRDVKVPGSADLNGDGKVNLVDFSILLFNWGKSGTIADINQDGTVNLTDLSIMLFNWTG